MNIQNQDHDPHGVLKLPGRTFPLIRAGIARGLNLLNPGATDIADKRFAHLPERDRASLRYFAADVPAVDSLATVTLGQAQAGLALAALYGKWRGCIDVSINTSVAALAATDISGAIVHQRGHAIPLIQGSFRRCSTAAVRVAADIAVSRTLLEQPSAEVALNAILNRAAVKVIDEESVRLALDGASAIASGANDPAQLLAQVNALGAALIAGGADPRFIDLAANPATLLQLATATTTTGARALPEVTVAGGNIGGMPLHASLGVAAGALVAVAGDSVLRSSAPPRIEASTSGSIEMASDPVSEAEPGQTPVGTAARRVGLFQADMVALRIIAQFGLDFSRATRAAFIDGINLAGDTTD